MSSYSIYAAYLFKNRLNLLQITFLKKLIFLYILDRFDALISKIIFFLKINYFDAFQYEKHFEKQPQPHSQTDPGII